jgi:chromosome segregation protein
LRTQRSCEEAVERTTAEAEQARRVFDAATRSAAEQEADRRARAAALEREQAELAAAAVDAENTLAATTELAAARVAERKVAETGLAEAEKAKRDVADALARVRAETAALVRRAEGLVRSRAETSARLAEAQTLAEELRRRLDRLVGELALAERGRRSDPAALAELEDALSTATAAWEKARHELERQEETARALEEEAAQFDEAFAAVREQLAVAEAERGHAHAALAASVTAVRDRLLQEPLALLADEATRAAVAEADPDELELRLGRLRASRDRLGPVNLRADVEAAELGAAVAETRAREAEMQQAVERLRAGIGTLDREARERLLAAFEAVDGHFRRLFTVLFGGGKAHLRLAGTDDPLEAGLELEASPPGKKLSSISLLSGGEKTLAALALVFGFFLAQPSPLCVLDEVDAPLDDANVERFIGLMEEIAQSTGTRFLVVTHHPLTMARMHRLYGVTMAERGISRLVSVALEQALELRATA